MSPHAHICAEPRCGTLTHQGNRCPQHQQEHNARRNQRSAALRTLAGRKLRKRVLAEEHRCAICGTTNNLTLGHIVARSQGGDPYARTNAQAECATCNYSRGGALAHHSYLSGRDTGDETR